MIEIKCLGIGAIILVKYEEKLNIAAVVQSDPERKPVWKRRDGNYVAFCAIYFPLNCKNSCRIARFNRM